MVIADDATVDANGRLCSGAKPWAKRVLADLEELAETDYNTETLLAELDGRVLLLFRDADFRSGLLGVNETILRAKAKTVRIPPPGFEAAAESEALQADENRNNLCVTFALVTIK